MDEINFLCTILVWLSALAVILNGIYLLILLVDKAKKIIGNNESEDVDNEDCYIYEENSNDPDLE